jgi:hypothetical protein
MCDRCIGSAVNCSRVHCPTLEAYLFGWWALSVLDLVLEAIFNLEKAMNRCMARQCVASPMGTQNLNTRRPLARFGTRLHPKHDLQIPCDEDEVPTAYIQVG